MCNAQCVVRSAQCALRNIAHCPPIGLQSTHRPAVLAHQRPPMGGSLVSENGWTMDDLETEGWFVCESPAQTSVFVQHVVVTSRKRTTPRYPSHPSTSRSRSPTTPPGGSLVSENGWPMGGLGPTCDGRVDNGMLPTVCVNYTYGRGCVGGCVCGNMCV